MEPGLILAHAQPLARGLTMDPDCEFCQIVRGERPARVVADAPDALAFFPLRPVCAGHTIVIPKAHVRDLWAAGSLPSAGLMQSVIDVGHAIRTALRPDGLNLISSAGQAASQTVFHLPSVKPATYPGTVTGMMGPAARGGGRGRCGSSADSRFLVLPGYVGPVDRTVES
jgi:histidine triad (HIT) family protein